MITRKATNTFTRGDIVRYSHHGRILLGNVVGGWYDGLGYGRLTVRHFNGEPWPIEPCAIFVYKIERDS